MNGLEAIELMKQGGVVFCKTDIADKVLFKIDNNVVYRSLKYKHGDGVWHKEEAFNFCLTYYEYIEPKLLIGWERVEEKEWYTTISHQLLKEHKELQDDFDGDLYEKANYFSTKEKAEEINFKQTLFRKLQRFSDENGGSEIDWNNFDQPKYYIKYFCYDSQKIRVECICTVRDFGQVYFVSEEVAQKAIELFYDDLIKYFTHDFGGSK